MNSVSCDEFVSLGLAAISAEISSDRFSDGTMRPETYEWEEPKIRHTCPTYTSIGGCIVRPKTHSHDPLRSDDSSERVNQDIYSGNTMFFGKKCLWLC